MDKKEYEELKKEHNLPAYEFLDKEFEISGIEEKQHLLSHIRDFIIERLEFLIKIIDQHLHPDINSFATAYECSCFTDEEKEELVKIYQELMKHHRSLLLANLSVDDKLTAQTITEVSKNWVNLRKSLLNYVRKLKLHWENLEENKELLRYLG